MNTETESRLRAALRAGADVITDDPANTPTLARTATRFARTDKGADRGRRQLLWSLAAVAAVIVAVAALAVGVRSSRHGAPSGQHQSGTSIPSPTQTTAAPTQQGLQAASCTVALPAQWRAALQAGRTLVGLRVLAATPGGEVIASRSSANGEELVVVKPGGSPRVLFRAPATMPGQGRVRITDAVSDSRRVVFSLGVGDGEPGRAGIDAVTLATGVVQVVRNADLGSFLIVSVPVLLAGQVYWAEVQNTGVGHVFGYDLAAGTKRTLGSGTLSSPMVAGGGLYWSKSGELVTHVRGALPPGYAVDPKNAVGLLHDGTTYAWQRSVDANWVISMSTAGSAALTVLRPENRDSLLEPLAIIGHDLVYSDGLTMRVLDTRTGATAELLSSVPGSVFADAGKLAIANNVSAGDRFSLIALTELPELRC